MDYIAFRNLMQKKYNAFPTGAAYSDAHLKSEMKRMGVRSGKELLSIGFGAFIRRKDKEAFYMLMDEIAREQDAYYADPDHWVDMFRTELANHEYCITYDLTDTLEVFGFTEETLSENPAMKEALIKAIGLYMADVENYT